MLMLATAGGCATLAPRAFVDACPEVGGLREVMAPGRVVLFGETHGTEEIPVFFGDVACAAAQARMPTTLAVEVWAEEQPAIDRYLASGDGDADRAALLAGPFWREVQDGRSSESMVRLLHRARALRAAGADLRVIAFDVRRGTDGPRDTRMAHALAAAAEARPGALMLVLVGNIHARTTRGIDFDSTFEPMAYVLASRLAAGRMVSLNRAHDGGAAWLCRPANDGSDRTECAARTLTPSPGAARWTVVVAPTTDGVYHGRFGVGPLTASPPASAAERP